MKDDTISRQAVLKLLSTMPPEDAMTKAMLIQSVKQMDATQPERKRGKWIDKNSLIATCSKCGVRWGSWRDMKYCPSCGAKMEGLEVSE